jgi:predicted anti-sigma-YlaC factor YlaD
MDQHASIRDLLALAAAGALDAAGERQVDEHLRDCADCRAEFQIWSRLTGALETLPTPQAPFGLVERTRGLIENRAAVRAEHRRNRMLLIWVNVLAWATTITIWAVFESIGDGLSATLGVSSTTLTTTWIVYTLAAWLGAVVAAGLLGRRYREGRVYEPVF